MMPICIGFLRSGHRRATLTVTTALSPWVTWGLSSAGVRVKGALPNELAEQRLDLAEKLWRARVKVCATPPAWNDSLALVMQKLAQ